MTPLSIVGLSLGIVTSIGTADLPAVGRRVEAMGEIDRFARLGRRVGTPCIVVSCGRLQARPRPARPVEDRSSLL